MRLGVFPCSQTVLWWRTSNERYGLKENGDENSDEEAPLDPADFAKEFGPIAMKDFRQNMTTLFDLIVKKAEKLKEDAQKQREAEAAKAQQESESAENK